MTLVLYCYGLQIRKEEWKMQENPFNGGGTQPPNEVVIESTATTVSSTVKPQTAEKTAEDTKEEPTVPEETKEVPVQVQKETAVVVTSNHSIIEASDISGIADIDFDTQVKIDAVERMPSMKKNEVIRIAFPLFNAKGSPAVKVAQVYYVEEHKISFLAPVHDKELLQRCVEKWGEPTLRFATVLAQYGTDFNGDVPVSGEWTHQLWGFRFGKDKFPEFQTIHRNWNLSKVDVMMKCEDEKYQKAIIQPVPECLFRKDEARAKKIIEDAHKLYQALDWMLGVKRSDDEIRAFLGELQEAPTVNPFSKKNQNPMKDQVGTGSAKTGEFDHLVTNPGGTKSA